MIRKLRKILFGSKIIRALKDGDTIMGGVLDWFYDGYTNLIIIPYETACRFFYWGWKLRHNYEWDCAYSTYYILYLNMQSFIDYSKKHAHLCWNSDKNNPGMRKLRIACELAKRLYEDDYNENQEKHREKWRIPLDDFLSEPYINATGRSFNRLKWKSDQELSKIQLEQNRKEFRIAIKLDDLQRENEKKYLFDLLEKYMDRWWD